MCSLYLGENLISGVATPVEPTRNIGQIIPSTIPLTDAGLHLLDGSLIQGSGIYSAFVDYIADLYDNSTKSPNINITGSLINNNGVISGFSASNYATTPQVFNPASNTWEQVWCFTTGSSVTSTQSVVGGNTGFANPLFRITSSGYINMLCSTNNSSWDVAITGSSALSVNTKYYVKGSFNGTEYKLELSTDGESFTTVGVVSSTSSIYTVDTQKLGNNNAGNETFLGSIDLKESYININGKRWWTGRQPICFTDEVQWQTAVSTYGVCGKFVYDSVNNTVRLPKYSNKIYTKSISSTAPVKGNGMSLGLNNGTYNVGLGAQSLNSDGGWRTAFSISPNSYGANVGSSYNQSAAYSGTVWGVTTDSTKSGIIADLSDITTSLDGYYYIVIATSTKTDIEVDIDEIATDLNGKADVDLTNVNNTGKIAIAHNAMPSSTYDDLTLGASGTTYTAPANGWIIFSKEATAANQNISLRKNGVIWDLAWAYGGGIYLFIQMPVRSGEVFGASYSAAGTLGYFRFYYAVGSESEAS